MASKATLILLLNILLFTMVSSTYVPCPPPPDKKHHHKNPNCPKDTLKFGVCANLLNLVNVVTGSLPKSSCCALLGNLSDLEAAICLCSALRANVLGINLNVPVSLSLLLNYCSKKMPHGFQCA